VATVALRCPAAVPWAAAVGVVGLFCSAMIYVDTRRVAWRFAQTAPRFFAGALALGGMVILVAGAAPVASGIAVGFALAVKLACDAQVMRCLDGVDSDARPTPAVQTARLLAGPLRPLFSLRIVTAVASLAALIAVAGAGALPKEGMWWLGASVVAGEFLERCLFFRSVDFPKMPGLPAGTEARGAA
jgi:DMSO reductase anchor subunit